MTPPARAGSGGCRRRREACRRLPRRAGPIRTARGSSGGRTSRRRRSGAASRGVFELVDRRHQPLGRDLRRILASGSGRRAGSAVRTRRGAGPAGRADRSPRSPAGTSGTPASSAIRAAPVCARASYFFRSPFFRRVPSGNMTTMCPSRQSCAAVSSAAVSRSPAADGERAGGGRELLERRPEELRLPHEPQVASREERQPQWPRVEVRVVVRGEHVAAVAAGARAPSRAAGRGHRGAAS